MLSETKQDVIISLQPEIDFSQDMLRNEYGAIRSRFVRGCYFSGNIVLSDVVDLFKEWKNDAEYFILRGTLEHTQKTFNSVNDCVGSEYIYRFIKASKRGNDVYRYLVNEKLKPLDKIRNITFFKDDWGDKNTKFLFVTLTYDTKRCDVRAAWENIGKDYHLFYTKLCKEYGEFEFFRTWESTKNFYPHVHILIGFKDTAFPVFIHTNKKGKRSFRIPRRDKDKISSFWHSNIDVRGIDNTGNAVKELTKYVTKDLCSDKGNKTNAMIWMFRKQSYAVSKGFVALIDSNFGKEIDISEPSNSDLIKSVMCNCNQDAKNWEFIGILRGEKLGFSAEMWVVDVKKPPPRVVDLLIYEYNRWNVLHRGRY